MALESGELVVGGTGTIYVTGAGYLALPDSFDEALTQWTEVGYTTEDGVTFRDSKEIREQKAWQSFYPIGRKITSRSAEAEFSMLQFNEDNLILAFGGGEVVTDGGTGWRYNPPSPEEVDLRSVVIEIEDGLEIWRIVIPECMVTSNTETKFTRTDDSVLPITLGVNGTDGDDPWYLLSNATGLAAAS